MQLVTHWQAFVYCRCLLSSQVKSRPVAWLYVLAKMQACRRPMFEGGLIAWRSQHAGHACNWAGSRSPPGSRSLGYHPGRFFETKTYVGTFYAYKGRIINMMEMKSVSSLDCSLTHCVRRSQTQANAYTACHFTSLKSVEEQIVQLHASRMFPWDFWSLGGSSDPPDPSPVATGLECKMCHYKMCQSAGGSSGPSV